MHYILLSNTIAFHSIFDILICSKLIVNVTYIEYTEHFNTLTNAV